MMLSRYRNELIVAAALVFAIGGLVYKYVRYTSVVEANRMIVKELSTVHEAAELKKVWGDRQIVKKLERIRTTVPAGKMLWRLKGRRLQATFRDLQDAKFNTVVSTFLSSAVQIESLKVDKGAQGYGLEIKCKW